VPCCLLAGLAAVLAGCGAQAPAMRTHTPMSQTTIFYDGGATRPVAGPAYEKELRDRLDLGVSGSSGGFSPGDVLRGTIVERVTDAGDVALDFDPSPLQRHSLGLYGSYRTTCDHALSFTMGSRAVGVDGTFKLWRRNYLTAGMSWGSGAQAFVQRRTLNSRTLGMAFGAGYRYERHMALVEDFSRLTRERDRRPIVGALNLASAHSLGGRAFVALRPSARLPGALLGNLYVGYAPATQHPVVAVGVSVNAF
jgi:hypothetical protein